MADFDLLQESFPNARILNNYGCTEAMPRLTVREVEGASDNIQNVGTAIPGVTLRIDGGDNNLPGKVLFNAQSSAIGVLTADGHISPFSEWTQSGDLGRLDDKTLFVQGRHDQIVTIGGERHSLIDLENSCRQAGLEQVHLWMGGNGRLMGACHASDKPDAKSLHLALAEWLPHKLWPSRLYWLDTWPQLPNGKTDRQLIQSMLLQQPDTPTLISKG